MGEGVKYCPKLRDVIYASHPERAVPNINKILPSNHYYHINLEGIRNSESQSIKSGF